MKKSWRTGAVLAVAALVYTGVIATPKVDAEQQAAGAALVDPALVSGMQYRHLSVFSRGGRSTAVVGVPSNPTLFYAGYTGGGVWQSTNSGETWTNLSDGFFEAGSVGAIDVSLSNPSVIYVGTGSACPRGNVSPGVGMYKSSDAGKTWQHVGLRGSGTIGRVRIHPTNPDVAYVAVLGNMFAPSDERGVYRTRDGGKSWQRVHFISNRTGAVDLAMDPKNPDILIAAMWTTERKPWTIESGSTEGGMFRSTDGGNTWTKLGGGLPDKVMVGRIGVSISGADSKRVYAQVEAADDQGGVFISNDGGLTWTRGFTGRAMQQRAWYYTHIHADPVDVDTVYGLNVAAFKSTDGGKTFGSAGIQSHSDYHDLWINPTNNKIIITGNDGGAAITTGTASASGAMWSGQDNQPTSEMYRASVDNRYPYYIYGGQQDNNTSGVSSANTDFIASMGGGESGYVAVDPRRASLNYAGNYGGTLQRIDRENGLSENVRVYADSQTGQRAADMKYRFQWNNPIKISWHTPDVVYTTSQVVHRTTDGGANWDVISPDLTRNDKRRQQYSGGEGITRDNTGVEVYATIFAFEESPTTPGLLWVGSDDGLVHVSRDNGKTWNNVTPKDWPEGTINTIDPSDHDPARAFVVMHRYRMGDFTPYIWRTDDYGKSWTRIADGTNGIPNTHFTRAIQEDPKKKGLLYAGTEFGMYISFNDGRNWQSFQNNLPRTPITDLQVFRNDLIVATQGRGYWVMDNLSPLQTMAPAEATPAAILYKPEDSYRQGGRLPTIQYWFKDKPTAPVQIEVRDAAGTVVWTAEAQPGDRPVPPPPGAGAPAGGRGARGGGGGGGRGGGRGGGGAGGGVTAYQGLNNATWNPRLPAMYQVPQGIVGWSIGGGQGPKVKPGVYTVKVTSGAWNATQTFNLNPDPRWPRATDAQYDEQFKMTVAIGQTTKKLWDELARIRSVKGQLQEHIKSAGATSAAGRAAQAYFDKLFANESILTQVQGEGGQDGLNYPGRLDNQWTVLYSNASATERWPNRGVIERYNDLLPETNKLLKDIETNLTSDLEAYNKIATGAKLTPVVIK